MLSATREGIRFDAPPINSGSIRIYERQSWCHYFREVQVVERNPLFFSNIALRAREGGNSIVGKFLPLPIMLLEFEWRKRVV